MFSRLLSAPVWLAASLLFAFGCGSAEALPQDTAPPVRNPRLLNQDSLLGYNLDFPGDWTDQPPFIDWMKNSRAPVGACSGDDPECDVHAHLDLGADGWPRSLRYRDDPRLEYRELQIIVSSSDEGPDVGKRFALTWDGNGSVQVDNGGSVQREGDSRLSFTLQSDTTTLRLTEIDAKNPLRNLRMFRSDFESELEQGELFDPETLAFLAPFRSLRFMDWMQSNAFGQCSGGSSSGDDCYAVFDDECGSGRCLMPGHWDERPLDDAPSLLASGQYLDPARPQLGTKVGGYALETLVALANRLPADPHFNLPADYDEDYVRRFAAYLKEHLSEDLVATIEYSNEVWNWGFPQAEYANQLGRKMWPDEGSAWVQYMAGRASTACRLVKQEFKGEEGRIRCVISPQTGWRGLAETVLDCPDWAADHGGVKCSDGIDAVSITGYFAGCMQNNPEVVNDWLGDGQEQALDHAFEQLEHGGLIDECSGDEEDNLDYTIEAYDYFGKLAAERGMGLYVYESGTHFSYEGEDEGVRDFFVEMTRDPRMRAAYLRNFQGFERAGGEIMNVWGWIGLDSPWANADSIRDRQHPKYRAILDFVGDRR